MHATEISHAIHSNVIQYEALVEKSVFEATKRLILILLPHSEEDRIPYKC